MGNLVRRYAIFTVGIFIISLGIGIITQADLGTSPITSIPLVLSVVFPDITVGTFTMLFSFLLVFLQWLLMGMRGLDRVAKVNLLLELMVSIPFGYMVDISLWLFDWLDPSTLPLQVLCVLSGILVLGVGVYLQVVADVVMIPGDGFVYALTRRVGIGYGKVRLASDTSMVVIAASIGLAHSGALIGVGLGSVMSCLMTGVVARYYMAHLGKLTARLIPGKDLDALAGGTRHGS